MSRKRVAGKSILTITVLFIITYISYYFSFKRKNVEPYVPGWPAHRNRDTKIYIPPYSDNTIYEPRHICRNKSRHKDKTLLLITVYSAPNNYAQRQAIRRSWGKYKNYIEAAKLYHEVKEKYKNYNLTFQEVWSDDNNIFLNSTLPHEIVNSIRMNLIDARIPVQVSGEESEEELKTNNTAKDFNIMPSKPLFSKLDFKLCFILGLPLHKGTQMDIHRENKKYRDILQAKFVDTYYNLTLKGITMMKWVSSKCKGQVRYVLKTDDDVYINLPSVVNDLRIRAKQFDHQTRDDTEYVMIGHSEKNRLPQEDKLQKWFSPKYMYSGTSYPNFLSGFGYVMSMPAVQALYEASKSTSYFHLEDIYITGLCAINAKPQIKAIDDPSFSLSTVKDCGLCCVLHHATLHNVQAPSMTMLNHFTRIYTFVDGSKESEGCVPCTTF